MLQKFHHLKFYVFALRVLFEVILSSHHFIAIKAKILPFSMHVKMSLIVIIFFLFANNIIIYKSFIHLEMNRKIELLLNIASNITVDRSKAIKINIYTTALICIHKPGQYYIFDID